MGRLKGHRLSALAMALGVTFLAAYGSNSVSAPVAAAGAATAKTDKHMIKQVAKPVKTTRAKSPPKGAKPSTALRFDKSVKWKTDPKTHSVFAVGESKQLWFMDPTSGWPYTIDSKGIVYTADPLTGNVYSMGALSSWSDDVLYFLDLWDYVDGRYVVPRYDSYYTIYSNNSISSYDYETAYTEVWEYDEYFTSKEFSEETVDTSEVDSNETSESDSSEAPTEDNDNEKENDDDSADDSSDDDRDGDEDGDDSSDDDSDGDDSSDDDSDEDDSSDDDSDGDDSSDDGGDDE